MFGKKTIKDVDIQGKTVLLRADFNVPIGTGGVVQDDYRIKQALPTIRYMLEQNCKVIICSHLGRPKEFGDKETSLEPVSHRLSELLGKNITFVHDCIGEEVQSAKRNLQAGDVLLLENLRWHKEEEANDETFAKALAEGAEIFVQDGFGVVHRAHASIDAVTKFLPSVAGFLLEKEVSTITQVMQQPEHPLMTVIGGAKISDKIEILEKFIEVSDYVAVVGAMASTFLMVEGIHVGSSLVDKDDTDEAKRILAMADAKTKKAPFTFFLPTDVVVAKDVTSEQPTRIVDLTAHNFADIMAYPKKPSPEAYTVAEDEKILDVGPMTAATIVGAIQMSRTLIWNGTAGVTEVAGLAGAADPYAHATKAILEAIEGKHAEDKNRPFTVVGGGDTAGYVMSHAAIDDQTGVPKYIAHVSTGGGASLELMTGKVLPGVAALLDKDKMV